MNSRLARRIITPIAAVSLLLIVLMASAAWYVHRVQAHAAEVLAENVGSIRAGEELTIGILEIRAAWRRSRHTGDPQALDEIAALRGRTDFWLREADRYATTTTERLLMGQVKRGYQAFFEQFDDWAATLSVPPSAEQVAATERLLAERVLKPVQKYLDHNEELAAQGLQENQEVTRLILVALLFLGLGGAEVGLLAGYGLARRLSRSLVQLNVSIQSAAGKLNEVVGPVSVTAGAELPELQDTLQNVARHIGAVVERLHQSEREVLRAEQLAAVGRLAAGLAHEIRNPLMAMKLLLTPTDGRSSPLLLNGRDVEVLNEELDTLECLVQSILDFARPPRVEKRSFVVQEVLEQAVLLVSGQAHSRGVQIKGLWPHTPVRIEADDGQLRQVLLNLLLNALDATPRDGTVTVELAPDADAPDWLVLRVLDTGCGFPPDLLPRLFQPFTTTKAHGLGLGLSICKRIVETHGGSITAGNGPEGGATFTIRLPLHEPRDGADAAGSQEGVSALS
jgi:two-component system sensor histidine kinase HydH